MRLNEPSELQQLLIPWRKKLTPGFSLRGWRSLPSGKPLIHFSHGNGLCCLAYEPFLTALSRTHDLFLYDIQGHGDSDCGTGFLGWEENARLMDTIWQDFKQDYADVDSIGIGHSMGAILTLLRASQFPDTFSRIFLLDPVLLSPAMIWGARLDELLKTKRKMPLAEQAKRRFNGWPDTATAFQFFHRQPFFKTWSSASLNAYIRHGLKQEQNELTLKCPPLLEASIFGSVPKTLWSAIRKLDTGTHLLYGSQSFPFIAASAHKASQKNKRISTLKVKGDHCFVQARPDEIATTLIHLMSGAEHAVAASV